MEPQESSFYQLNPDTVLAACEEAGFHPTGEFIQLNSYENRVFDIRLEAGQEIQRVIGKFYRPQRWSRDAILEEHLFMRDLENEGVPVVAPLRLKNNQTLIDFNGLVVGFFPKFVGRMPDEFLGGDLFQMGRRLALLHNIGNRKKFSYRPELGYDPAPEINLEFLQQWISPEVRQRYEEAVNIILDFLSDNLEFDNYLRIHGDCHRGNLLQRKLTSNSSEFFFVDFDDCMMGPEVQDFWMLFSGDEFERERDLIISGYEELRSFPKQQLPLIPGLRGLRIFNYAAWIALRWQDPSFPRIFPHFNSYTYWAEETEALEKIAWSLDETNESFNEPY